MIRQLKKVKEDVKTDEDVKLFRLILIKKNGGGAGDMADFILGAEGNQFGIIAFSHKNFYVYNGKEILYECKLNVGFGSGFALVVGLSMKLDSLLEKNSLNPESVIEWVSKVLSDSSGINSTQAYDEWRWENK